MHSSVSKGSLLPALSPDLLVSLSGQDVWRIEQTSPRLLRWLDREAEERSGRLLSHLLPRTTPDLSDLAREVLSRDTVLKGIRIRLADGRQVLATAAPGGMTEDYRPLVAFVFQPVPETQRQAVEGCHGLVGVSAGLHEVCRKINLYAPSDAPVVVTGETGTGKELVAQALHEQGARSGGPFVAVNCSAISEELLESELFGHEKGAFTGAVRTHLGRFERADGGTLFLDEVGEMPLHTQAKLLRVLETGSIERVGAERERQIDVRVVAATNVPMERAVGEGRFRPDLYHRLSVLRIHLPALRERLEDVPPLVSHFLEQFNRRYGRKVQKLTREALELLQSYLWPGNIRELRNVLERVFVESVGEIIGARAFSEWVRERRDFSPGGWDMQSAPQSGAPPMIPPYPLPSTQPLLSPPARDVLDAELVSRAPTVRSSRSTSPLNLDEGTIRRAYKAAQGNLAAAARLLGVHRATLYRYLEKLGLSREDLQD